MKLTDHNHGKYITTPEFDRISADVFDARLVDLVTSKFSNKDRF